MLLTQEEGSVNEHSDMHFVQPVGWEHMIRALDLL